jgi:ADP-ribose pyrophosphatase
LQPSATTECLISFGTYKGQEYQSKDTVRISQCLVESKFLKIQQHQVQFAGKSVILDWLWIDYHERINVLVQGISADKNTFFHVFEQTKYALEDRLSMAIVGGIVEPGEQPMDAARREVQEEMQMECQEMVFLGRFRTDVNRGMGWTNGFLAKGCSKATNHKLHKESEEKEEEVGVADTEQQDLKTITLQELRKLVQDGQFLEIQWTAIVSLAILHLQDNTP